MFQFVRSSTAIWVCGIPHWRTSATFTGHFHAGTSSPRISCLPHTCELSNPSWNAWLFFHAHGFVGYDGHQSPISTHPSMLQHSGTLLSHPYIWNCQGQHSYQDIQMCRIIWLSWTTLRPARWTWLQDCDYCRILGGGGERSTRHLRATPMCQSCDSSRWHLGLIYIRVWSTYIYVWSTSMLNLYYMHS